MWNFLLDVAQSYLQILRIKFGFYKKLVWGFSGQHREVANKFGRL